MRRRDWWRGATNEARLVQISAASKMGLSAQDTATLLGTTRADILQFSHPHGVTFATGGKPARTARASRNHESEALHGVVPLDRQLARTGAF